MHYDWILFDADHTLFDFDRTAAEALAETALTHGIAYKEEHWPIYDNINKQCWNDYENGVINRETLRTRRFALFLEEIDAMVVDLEIFAADYLNQLPSRPYFIDGALDLLHGLHGKVRLGIITNGLAEVQRPRLVATGIDRLFDVIVVSGEIGHMKPSREYFEYTHVQMIRPDGARVLVVGDSLNADIRGGRDFGFDTCWFNPAQAPNDSEIVPIFQINALHQLIAILGA